MDYDGDYIIHQGTYISVSYYDVCEVKIIFFVGIITSTYVHTIFLLLLFMQLRLFKNIIIILI